MRPLSRGERKSLALHRAIAARIAEDPGLVEVARRRLAWLRHQHPAGESRYARWSALLDGPLDALLAVLQEDTDDARDLRHDNPFADVIDQRTRARIFAEAAGAEGGVAR